MRTKEKLELEFAYEREHGIPVPKVMMKPHYREHATCDVCWDGYLWAFWHRWFRGHRPDEDVRAKNRWMREHRHPAKGDENDWDV